ncbi:MAG TPA: hypothetical protein VGG71_10190, partial [Chitinophagaceae bacterium]
MSFPTIDVPIADNSVEVNLNIPDEVAPSIGGGGGGGNIVQATGPKGTAHSVPQPGEKEDVKDVEDSKDKESPAILKPDVPKPTATKINSNKSIVKTTPKLVVETPAPPKPKAIMGKTTGGSGTGGGVADNYDRAGGKGNGSGAGNGNGVYGGSGNGAGGGNGTGNGLGSGPKNFGTKTWSINQSFEDEFNENAKVAMDIVADERGNVLSATFQPRGSTTSNRKLIDIAERRAKELKLGSSGSGQKGTVIFDFKLKS